MVVPAMASLAAVLLGELDPVTFYAVNRANVSTVGSHHFHVLSDAAELGHDNLLITRKLHNELEHAWMHAGKLRSRSVVVLSPPLVDNTAEALTCTDADNQQRVNRSTGTLIRTIQPTAIPVCHPGKLVGLGLTQITPD